MRMRRFSPHAVLLVAAICAACEVAAQQCTITPGADRVIERISARWKILQIRQVESYLPGQPPVRYQRDTVIDIDTGTVGRVSVTVTSLNDGKPPPFTGEEKTLETAKIDFAGLTRARDALSRAGDSDQVEAAALALLEVSEEIWTDLYKITIWRSPWLLAGGPDDIRSVADHARHLLVVGFIYGDVNVKFSGELIALHPGTYSSPLNALHERYKAAKKMAYQVKNRKRANAGMQEMQIVEAEFAATFVQQYFDVLLALGAQMRK